jgi:hypothetical protein
MGEPGPSRRDGIRVPARKRVKDFGVWRRLLGGAVGALLAAACGDGAGAQSRQEAQRIAFEESVRQGQELVAALENLEARLINGLASERLWNELSQRHQKVSALACKNAEMHAAGLLRQAARNSANSQALRRRIAASRQGVVTDAEVTGYKTTAPVRGERGRAAPSFEPPKPSP